MLPRRANAPVGGSISGTRWICAEETLFPRADREAAEAAPRRRNRDAIAFAALSSFRRFGGLTKTRHRPHGFSRFCPVSHELARAEETSGLGWAGPEPGSGKGPSCLFKEERHIFSKIGLHFFALQNGRKTCSFMHNSHVGTPGHTHTSDNNRLYTQHM
jgi:hypothetical protein